MHGEVRICTNMYHNYANGIPNNDYIVCFERFHEANEAQFHNWNLLSGFWGAQWSKIDVGKLNWDGNQIAYCATHTQFCHMC